MTGSEYSDDYLPDLLWLLQRPYILHSFAEPDETAAMEVVNPNVLRTPRSRLQKSSRLQRLSTFLPNLTISPERSKLSKDTLQRPLVPRKEAPTHQNEPPRPPTREAPPAPPQKTESIPPPTKRLQKAEPPTQLKPLPNPRAGSPARTVTNPEELQPRQRRNSLLAMIPGTHPQTRSASSPINSRPGSCHSGEDGSDHATGSKLRRKSFLPGGKSKSRHSSNESHETHGTGAWVNAGAHKIDYNMALLANGEKVPELWDDNADTFVYLFPQSSSRGPSFKVPSMTLSSSFILMNYINSQNNSNPSQTGRSRGRSFTGRTSLSVEDATRNLSLNGLGTPPYTPKTSMSDTQSSSTSDGQPDFQSFSFVDGPRERHLYFPTGLTSDGSHSPLTGEDIQILVDIRNLFAYLTGQPLVGTRACPDTFRIFLTIGSMLSRFEFTNIDGSTFGESSTASFEFYIEELQLQDVRKSREKTIEGLILGEAMRCADLYTEAFTHMVGKYSSIMQQEYPLFKEISPSTRIRLERAHQELAGRQQSASLSLTDFTFPSLFAGIASSTTVDESKYVNFKSWKTHFMTMRKHVISHLKDVHGTWPPRANAKKGVAGGLNRQVLKGLYADMCSFYDLKADREAITTRSLDASDDQQSTNVSPNSAALRKLLGEFDRSTPPVNPPIPFDVPLVPSMAAIDPTFNSMSPVDQKKASTRKLKSHEIALILSKTHNADCDFKTPFLDMYKRFEEKEAKGKTAQELADMVYGHWIFMYAVIQSLPMLVVDAQGLRYTSGVEHFLCMAPTGKPWVEESNSALYRVQGGGVVSLPSHLVESGPEATYRRSHCWTIADQWINQGEGKVVESQPSFLPEMLSPLAPPPGFAAAGEYDMGPPTGGSPGGSPVLSPTDTRGRHDRNMSGTLASPQLGPNSDNRSRSRQAQRQSIALGLERLPIPAGHENYSPRPGSSRGQSPGGWQRGQSPGGMYSHSRNGSVGRLDTPADNTGATFDDILGNIGGTSDAKGKKGKKK